MKNSLKSLCILFVVFFSQNLSAQNEIYDDSIVIEESERYDSRHILRVNLPSFFLKSYAFQYEFFPTRSMSLGVGYKFTPERGMVFKDKVIEIIEDANDLEDLSSPAGKFFEKFKFKGNTWTPELRFYLGHGYGKGFYLGPMLRFDNYDIESEYLLITADRDYYVDFKGKFKAFGFGLLIGAQFPIGKHLTLDTFIAPYLSNIKVNFDSDFDFTLTDEAAEQLRDEVNQIKLPNGETEIIVNNTSATGKMTADTFPNLRVGIGFGYRF
ncbi:MAG: DUF3575 domain-containing protein [Weeksellaceae bacterium]